MTIPDWSAIEAAYRGGATPVARIVQDFRISHSQLYQRARREGWPPRRPRLPVGPQRLEQIAGKAEDMTVRMLARLTQTLARHINELEDQARLPNRSEKDREREAKALAALAAVLDRIVELANRIERPPPTAEETAETHDRLIAALAERVARHRHAGGGGPLR